MSIRLNYDRAGYVKAVKNIGESIARRAEEIVPEDITAVRDIDIFGNIEPGAIATFSWTVNAYALDEKSGTCKTENRPSDARTTTAWATMPESPNDDKTGDLRHRIDQCETDIEMLLGTVNAIITKLTKE